MIFVDTNVPIYVVGGNHPNKTLAEVLLERAAAGRERLVTDAEVFQEILHRYLAIDRRNAIQPAFDLLYGIIDDVFPVDSAAVDLAKGIVLGYADLSARDAIHAATMQQHGVTRIISFDTGFDRLPGIVRISA